VADWPSGYAAGAVVAVVGSVPGSSRGTRIAIGATPNTKTSWTELVASTPIAAQGFYVTLQQDSAAADTHVDVAFGASGAEKTLVGNMLLSESGGDQGVVYFFPVAIAAGTRLAVRAQSSLASPNVDVMLHLASANYLGAPGLARVRTYGADASDSGGTSIDPGGTANTEGAIVEIIANSNTFPIHALTVAIGNQANSTQTGTLNWLFDILIGASGAEKILIEDLQVFATTAGDLASPMVFGPFFVDIPAGTRVSARCQSANIEATDRLKDVILYGMY